LEDDDRLATLLKTKTILKPYVTIDRFDPKDEKNCIRNEEIWK
jgi:hypothetical protein